MRNFACVSHRRTRLSFFLGVIMLNKGANVCWCLISSKAQACGYALQYFPPLVAGCFVVLCVFWGSQYQDPLCLQCTQDLGGAEFSLDFLGQVRNIPRAEFSPAEKTPYRIPLPPRYKRPSSLCGRPPGPPFSLADTATIADKCQEVLSQAAFETKDLPKPCMPLTAAGCVVMDRLINWVGHHHPPLFAVFRAVRQILYQVHGVRGECVPWPPPMRPRGQACAAAACRSTRFLELHIGVWKHAAACRSTRFLELHIGVWKHAAASRSIQFFEFMCLSACSCSVCTGDILPAPCLPSLFFFCLVMSQSSAPTTSSQQSTPSTPIRPNSVVHVVFCL